MLLTLRLDGLQKSFTAYVKKLYANLLNELSSAVKTLYESEHDPMEGSA